MRYRSEYRLFFPWTIICCMFKSQWTWQSIYMHRQWDSEECCIFASFTQLICIVSIYLSIYIKTSCVYVCLFVCKKSVCIWRHYKYIRVCICTDNGKAKNLSIYIKISCLCVEWRHVCVSTDVMFVDWRNCTSGHRDTNDDRDTGTSYIYINKLSVCLCF